MPAVASWPSLDELRRVSERFEDASAEDIVRWALDVYGPRVVALSSFGASSGALLHLISTIDHTVPVAFLHTHYHFPETLAFRDELAERYGLTVENWESLGGRPGFLAQYPDDLNRRETTEGLPVPAAAEGKVRTGADLCCWVNKVEPLQRALRNRLAYFTALRRDGGSEVRARTRVLEAYSSPYRAEPLVKVNPLANWSRQQLWRYINDNDIPTHPLWEQGYRSIGCHPCTAVAREDDERSGRWAGQGKTECGIHTAHKPLDYSI